MSHSPIENTIVTKTDGGRPLLLLATAAAISAALSTITLCIGLLSGHKFSFEFETAVVAAVTSVAAVSAAIIYRRLVQNQHRHLEESNSTLEQTLERERRLVEEMEDLNQLMGQISAHFSDLFRKIPAPCFCYDSDGRFKEWNKAFESLTLVEPGRLLNERVSSYIHIDSDPHKMSAVIAAVFKGEAFEGIELQTPSAGGSIKTLLCNTFPLRGEGGSVTAAICAGIDITERINLEQRMLKHVEKLSAAQLKLEEQHTELVTVNAKLETLAMSDSLTGLKNHRALQERLSVEFKRSLRYGSTVSLLLIDVDRFKKYNDTYGHLAGDAVLRQVADTLTYCMRDTDFVARYGGEEFIAVLPHTDYLGSLEAAERLRAAVEQISWELIRVTVSIGAVTMNSNMQHSSDLIAKADIALYYCKQHGRNQVVHAQDIPDAASIPDQGVTGATIDLDEESSYAA